MTSREWQEVAEETMDELKNMSTIVSHLDKQSRLVPALLHSAKSTETIYWRPQA